MTDQPKRIGRPPTSDPWVKLTINLKASELAAIDARRGEATRPEYVRAVVNGINVPREPTPAQMAPVRAATVEKIDKAISSFRPHPKAGKKV